MADLKIESLFISGQENVTYLTEVAGLQTGDREAFILLTRKETYLLVFSTTFGLYKNVSHFNPLEITPKYKISQAINEILSKNKIKSTGFEKTNLTFSEFESLKKKIKAELIPTENIVEELRLIKSVEELKKIKKAAAITDLAFLFILTKIKPGKSEKELALELEFFIRNRTADVSFSPIVAFNENAAIPHYLPSTHKNLAANCLILIDMGAKFQNYCADLTRVVFLGTPDRKLFDVFETVKKAQELAINSLKIGLSGDQIDSIARGYIEKRSFPAYKHGLGHGVGLAIHELPRLRPAIKDKLQENMVFTIEPGIYLEGKAGVRIEDLLVLRKNGPEVLSHASKEIIIL